MYKVIQAHLLIRYLRQKKLGSEQCFFRVLSRYAGRASAIVKIPSPDSNIQAYSGLKA